MSAKGCVRRILRTLRKTRRAAVPPTVIRGSGRGLYSPRRDRLAGFEDIRIAVATYKTVVHRSRSGSRRFVTAAWGTEKRAGPKGPALLVTYLLTFNFQV